MYSTQISKWKKQLLFAIRYLFGTIPEPKWNEKHCLSSSGTIHCGNAVQSAHNLMTKQLWLRESANQIAEPDVAVRKWYLSQYNLLTFL